MKILSFNIRHGGGRRRRAILHSILGHQPDTVVLSEFRDNDNGRFLRERLQAEGYQAFSCTAPEHKTNAVAIASKQAFTITSLEAELGGEAKRVLLARFSNITIMGVYFAQKKAKRALFDFINRKQQLLGERGLVIGDFNTGKHYLDEAKNSFYCADDFVRLEQSGLVDAWRSRNPDKREYSWYSSSGNGFRIDHAFVTPALDLCIERIFYSHTEREQGVSDHSAFVVEFSGQQA